jgi:acetyltransferase
VDFGDIIDYLASDSDTRAILLYIESVQQARKFMSAARAAARNKPVIAVKSGRALEGQRAAASHTGALAGGDAVYSAAFRRAGIVRVDTIDALFAAAETLARTRRLRGERLVILTNGGGPGVMAVDALIMGQGKLAVLSPATIEQLNQILPATWSQANPVDIIGDATPERYQAALKVLLDDSGVDAALVMHAPTAVAAADLVAQGVINAAGSPEKNVLTCWLGGNGLEEARRLFNAAQLPTYDTPEAAVQAFLHMIEYHRSQEALLQTPPAAPTTFSPDTPSAKAVIETALAQDRTLLSEVEAKQILAAYGVPVVGTQTVRSADEAVAAATRLGFPAVLKILSPDITHKSDVGGVALDLEDAHAVRKAAEEMQNRVRGWRPDARLDGFTVQAMERRHLGFELIIGVATDPIFGPVILFGHGGTAAEIVRDRAVALPPLNLALAKELITRTRIYRLLAGYRDRAAVDLDALALVLVRISQLMVDFSELAELDINPLVIDSKGMVALDARIVLARSRTQGCERLAIKPYPQNLEEPFVMASGHEVLLRPIRPEDEPEHVAFFTRLKPEDIRFRFFGLVRDLPHSEIARYTQIDYDREMAFIATTPGTEGKPETLGVVRIVADPDNQNGEFAIIVRSDLKGQGLGHALMEKMIRYCRDRGIGRITGQILQENTAMRQLAANLGFEIRTVRSERLIEATLDLRPGEASPSPQAARASFRS